MSDSHLTDGPPSVLIVVDTAVGRIVYGDGDDTFGPLVGPATKPFTVALDDGELLLLVNPQETGTTLAVYSREACSSYTLRGSLMVAASMPNMPTTLLR